MDPLERLQEAHEGRLRLDPHAYTTLVREALRMAPAITRELMQETYETGLKEAYAEGSEGSIAEVALMGAAQLAAIGDSDGAIARLDQALLMTRESADASALLLATRAAYVSFSPSPLGARSDATLALASLSADTPPGVAIDVRTSVSIVDLVLLGPTAIEEATETIAIARSAQLNALASSLMVFLISAHAASEDVNQAIAWADALHGYAASIPHPARELDAQVAQLALRSRNELVALPPELEEVGQRTLNSVALWRLYVLSAYLGMMRADSDEVDRALASISASRGTLSSGFRSASDGFGAVANALYETGPIGDLTTPAVPSLLNFGAALASAEAVAIAGSQSVAADWLRWFEAVPDSLQTSLEWPACRRRIEGLLLLRLGREREAVTRLQSGIDCCESRRAGIQAAVGRVQLAEALLRGTTASMLPATHARSLRQTGADELRRLGIDPIPFAYAASRTFLREEQKPERGGLTPREAQVLGRLARGMSYREIGVDLGINSRTVGVHASHCYEKLGVRNRVEAVKLAQDLGIV